jgi:hypothetical protein
MANKKKKIVVNKNKNKNKNSIHITINSNNKKRVVNGGAKKQNPSPTIIVSQPSVPSIPSHTVNNYYPNIPEVRERLEIQAKNTPTEVKVGEINQDITPLKKVKVAPEDKSILKPYDLNSVNSLNDEFAPIFPLPSLSGVSKPPPLPSPYTPIKKIDDRPRIANPTGRGIPILVGGAAYKRYVNMGLIKDIQ